MSTPPSLPSVPGLTWARRKKPQFKTRIAGHTSGREVRVADYVNPLYEFEAVYSGLTSATASGALAGLGSSSLQALMGFHAQMQGQFGTFLYADPDDDTVTGGAIATGDGSTQRFVITRTLGGFTEPVSWVTNVGNVYLNGVAQPTADWLFTAPNMLGFATAPGAGVAITADFTFAFQCRFLDDQLGFEEFMSALWKLDSLKSRSVKANTSASGAAIPTWYSIYQIGGVNPYIFADPTTEGAANHYLYNGSAYGSFSALLSAIGGTFSRASSKYVTSASGHLGSIAANALPFDYSSTSIGTSNGLLLEGGSTNQFLYSNAFTTGFNFIGTASASQNVSGPDGVANSAWAYTSGSSNAEMYQEVTGLPSSGSATFSLYVDPTVTQFPFLCIESGGGDYAFAVFHLDGSHPTATQTGVLGHTLTGTSATPAANGFYRIALSISFTVAPLFMVMAAAQAATGTTVSGGDITNAFSSGAAFAIYGAQLEMLPLASSYIPTTSSTASRAADSLTFPWTATAATYRIKTTQMAGLLSANASALTDGTTNNWFINYRSATQVSINTTAVLSETISNALGQNTIIIAGNGSGRVLSVNGVAAVSDTNGLTVGSITELQVGGGPSGNLTAIYGDVGQFAAWTVVATTAQAATLSGTP